MIGRGRRWAPGSRGSLGGLRRRWGWATGAALVSGFLGVPLVWGNAALPVDIPLLDNVAWLPDDAHGDVVRVNGETGEVDARLDVGDDGAQAEVEQAEGVALVEIDGEVRAIDVARLQWGQRVSAEGEVVVGEGAAYLVRNDGLVRVLDPESLDPAGEVQLAAAPGRGVVVQGRLVVPASDGRLHVVDRDGRVRSVAAGDPQDDTHVSLVGDEIVAVNLTAGRLRRFELRAAGGALRHAGEVALHLPEGEVVVPARLPAGRLWLLAQGSGELLGIDVSSGEVISTQVTEPRRDVAGPVVAGDRVYLVDLTDGRLVEVDAETLEQVHEETLPVEDPAQVDLVVQGETVFVNDRASSQAMVINGDERRPVDKHAGADVPGDAAPTRPPRPLDPPPQQGDRNDPDRRGGQGPSTTITVVPGSSSTTRTSTTTTTLPPTTTTLPPTTTTTRPLAPPGPVTGLSATAGDGTVSLRWGGAASSLPVTYTIAVSPAAPGGTTFTTTAQAYTFTGLTNGVTYRFTITPTNSDGAGTAAQTDATPEAPQVGPSLVDVSVAEKNGAGTGNPYIVLVHYSPGTGTSGSCTVSQSGGPTMNGYCSARSESTNTVGDFTIPPGECATFTVTLTTSVGTDTGSASACAPAPATTTTTALQGSPCTINGQPATCYPGG